MLSDGIYASKSLPIHSLFIVNGSGWNLDHLGNGSFFVVLITKVIDACQLLAHSLLHFRTLFLTTGLIY